MLLYTAKSAQYVQDCWKQMPTGLVCCKHCVMLSTILFSIVTPDCGLIQAQKYCSILVTTKNNVASTTLLHPVFNKLLQLIIFCRVGWHSNVRVSPMSSTPTFYIKGIYGNIFPYWLIHIRTCGVIIISVVNFFVACSVSEILKDKWY